MYYNLRKTVTIRIGSINKKKEDTMMMLNSDFVLRLLVEAEYWVLLSTEYRASIQVTAPISWVSLGRSS